MQTESKAVDLVPASTVRHLAGAAVVAALTGVLAQLSIPLPGGVPFSLQPFGVLLAGLLLGPAWGGFSMVLYLAVGLAGAPVFSNFGAGLGYLASPTGGFLIGFVLGAVVVGALAHRSLEPRPLDALRWPVVAGAALAALVPIYAVGLPWLATVNDWSLVRAATFLAPFLGSDLLKVAILVGVVHQAGERLDAVR